jgi:hypothetical protein
MTASRTAKSIPTAQQAKSHPLAGTVRNAVKAAKRDGRTYFVTCTYTGYGISASAPLTGRYFECTADSVTEVA